MCVNSLPSSFGPKTNEASPERINFVENIVACLGKPTYNCVCVCVCVRVLHWHYAEDCHDSHLSFVLTINAGSLSHLDQFPPCVN